MTRSLIIFGTSELAEVAHYYFSNDSVYDVKAFTVDSDYITTDSFCHLPVIPFEEVSSLYPTTSHEMFVALSYSKVNSVRMSKYRAVKALGYSCPSYVSSKATVLNHGRIGDNCLILEDNTIQPFATIGNNVTLWSGNHIGHHSSIGDHTFISSHVVVSGGVSIGEQCFIGVNATIRDHLTIGDRCVIGAGALLLSNAEAEGVYIGQETSRSSVPSSRLRRI
jgi:sugar O-acyltransferase (sialic acid O-acetyltransferase NeuD family)